MSMANRRKLHIYLLNDEIHTFEYVTQALMAGCDMNALQAEQCAIFVDAHKEYKVATVGPDDALFIYKNLSQFGLNVELRKK